MKMIRLAIFVAIAAAAVVGTAADVPTSCVGIWRGGRSGHAAESYLVIRSDSTGGAFGVSDNGEEFKVYEFEFETMDGVMKPTRRWSVRRGKRREYDDAEKCTLWVDQGSGWLLMSDGTRTNVFERAEGKDDPFRRGVEKTRKELVVGVWRGGSEFNAYTIVLSETGEAMLLFAVGGAMGRWSMVDDGNVNLALEAAGVSTNILVRYDAAEDTMRIGNNVAIGRNVKDTPEAALRSVKERLAEQQREIQRRQDAKLAGKSRFVTTNSFETVDEIFKCLLSDTDDGFFARSISCDTGVDGLTDVFSITKECSLFGNVRLECGYSETGPCPSGAEAVRRNCVYSRPKDMLDAQRAFVQGIEEARTSSKTFDRVTCEDEYLVRSQGGWRSWTQGVRISWFLGKGQESDVASLLRSRFKNRLPCKGVVMTIRQTK